MTTHEWARAAVADIRQLRRTNPDATAEDLVTVIEQAIAGAVAGDRAGALSEAESASDASHASPASPASPSPPLPPASLGMRVCKNCGDAFAPVRRNHKKFCGLPCARAWHSRESKRRSRAAALAQYAEACSAQRDDA